MSLLAVRPKYQRRGLGSMLLAPVLELADGENAKTFIQASAEGLGLYQRFGWKQVDEMVIDFSSYGGPKQVKTTLLIREPRSDKGI
jgi:predicted N-acetyltransferase YhbS